LEDSPAILVIELNSVAGGVFVSDVLVKRAVVTLLDSRTVCPGKYVVTLTGDVEALASSLDAARDSDLGETITEHHLIPRVHPAVVSALRGVPHGGPVRSIGVIETYGVAACVRAADEGAKAGAVDIVELRLANAQGGRCVVVFSGEQDEIETALEAGRDAAEEMQALVNSVLIERPHECMERFLNS